MKIFKLHTLILFICLALTFSCKNSGGVNVFSIEDDKQLGKEMNDYIHSDSSGMIVLDPARYPAAYSHLNRIRDYVLNSSHVRYRNDFVWQVRIIKNDTILNAFATPGGYLYFYTGLIKYLDSEDHFAGVMAHEIAHSDRRHSTQQLTKVYGIQTLLSVLLGKNRGLLRDITTSLIALSFSREAEEEADNFSVNYLCRESAQYEADGAAGFFKKLIEEGKSGGTPEFLSTHPNPPNRVKNIEERAVAHGCDTNLKNPGSYQEFKRSLP